MYFVRWKAIATTPCNATCKYIMSPVPTATFIRCETGFDPVARSHKQNANQFNDLIGFKLNHLVEVVSNRFSRYAGVNNW